MKIFLSLIAAAAILMDFCTAAPSIDARGLAHNVRLDFLQVPKVLAYYGKDPKGDDLHVTPNDELTKMCTVGGTKFSGAGYSWVIHPGKCYNFRDDISWREKNGRCFSVPPGTFYDTGRGPCKFFNTRCGPNGAVPKGNGVAVPSYTNRNNFWLGDDLQSVVCYA